MKQKKAMEVSTIFWFTLGILFLIAAIIAIKYISGGFKLPNFLGP